MTVPVLALLFLGLVPASQGVQGQTLGIPLTEPFDDASQLSVTQGTLIQDTEEDYFVLAQNANPGIDKSYAGSGTNFLAGQDLDDDQVSSDPAQIEWTGIDISGESGLVFTGSFGEVLDGTGDIDESDLLRVEYQIDGGGYQTLVQFAGNQTNGEFLEDTDFDGTGDGQSISSSDGSLVSFTKNISGTGSTLDLRFTASVNAKDEDFAVDEFKVASSFVQFTAGSGTVRESEGEAKLAVEILSPPSGTSVSADVVFIEGSSSASSGDVNSFGTKSVTFSSGASGGETEAITVNLNSGDGAEGEETALFRLQNVSGSATTGQPSQFDLTIQDNVGDHDGDVLITEFMPNPSAVNDSDGEYVELYNATTSPKSIDGWDIDGNTISGVTIPARGFTVICRNSDASTNGGIQSCDDEISLGLSNGSDAVVLSNSSGTEVDRIDYDDTNWPDPAGASIVFTGTSYNNDGNNWAEASRRERGFALDQSGDDGSPGRNGDQQSLQPTTEITGSGGWRMLSAPMGGVDPDALAQVSLVQGVSGHFPDAPANLYAWPGGPPSSTSWSAPASATADLTSNGQGFVWYVFGTAETEFTDTPPFTLSLPGSPRTSDVTTGSLGGGFHLLGNPYAQSFDVSELNLAAQNFQTTIQIWDPSANSYQQILQSSTSDDFVGPYQGFFVERTASGSAPLTFSASGRRADPISLKNVEDGPPRIQFRLVGRDEEGAVRTRDEALALHAPEGATTGWDVHDASKLTPLSSRYATAAVRDTVDGKVRLQSVVSVPPALPAEGIELPVSLQVQGADSVDATEFAWPTWENVPDSWGIALHDAVADSTVNLRTHSAYVFTLSPSKAQAEPPARSPLETPDRIRAAAESDEARFTLTVQPTPIPVELTDFGATLSGKTARLTWTTASETNNAGFHVEHRGPSAGQFASVGFVEGRGTTDTSQQYRFRTDPLDPGRHLFRLRQVDLDGTATRSDTVAVTVGAAAAVSAEVSPNPVRTSATVSLHVRTEQEVTVALYDVLGRRVRTLYDAPLSPDRPRRLQMDARGLSSGLYFLRVHGERVQVTRRVTVVR